MNQNQQYERPEMIVVELDADIILKSNGIDLPDLDVQTGKKAEW